VKRARTSLRTVSVRARPALNRIIDRSHRKLDAESKLLNTLSYQSTLARGYAILRTETGSVIRSSDQAAGEEKVRVTLADGDLLMTPGELTESALPKPKPGAKPKPKKKAANSKKPATSSDDQGRLF